MSSASFKKGYLQNMCLQITYLVYMNKQDFVLINL